MSPIRSFLALPLPKTLREYLSRIADPFKNDKDVINWVKSANIHITLNFLGDADPELIEEQSKGMQSVVNSHPPIKLGTLDTGIFPHANDPRVLWVGTAPYDNTLATFKKNMDDHLKQIGYQLDKRKFQPHITIGRVKSISRKSTFVHDFLSKEVNEIAFEIDEVKWLKSTLTPAGAIYEELNSFKFNTGGQA